MDKGEVIEVGTPKELFAEGGMFREMIVASGLEKRMSE
jgi:ABC-type multidrug transport system fused ATPase/permease subunit